MSKIKSVPASMFTVQFNVRWLVAELEIGMSQAVPPGTMPCRPTGLRAFPFHVTATDPHCSGFDFGSTQK